MSLSLIFYLISVSYSIKVFFLISIGFLLCAFVATLWTYADECDSSDELFYFFRHKNFKIFSALFTFLVVASILIPDEKDSYLIVGTHYLGKSEIPKKVIEVINHKLDDILGSQTVKSGT